MKANKRLGQNFLVNPATGQRIVDACGITKSDPVLEIGPGRGALTRLLVGRAAVVFAVEADRALAAGLPEACPHAGLRVIAGDFLKTDLSFLPPNTKIVGNIPYYISTPILEKLIANRTQLNEAFLTVQLEFGQRLTARPHTKNYGSLTCYTRYFAETQILFRIGSRAFRPAPKVTSCLVHLKFRPYPQPAGNEESLFRLIRTAFLHRRKKLANALSTVAPASRLNAAFVGLNISPNSRAENLTLDDYIRLADDLDSPAGPDDSQQAQKKNRGTRYTKDVNN